MLPFDPAMGSGHPLDQFRAFVALHAKGQGEEAVAAAFFATPQIVKRRLKITSMTPWGLRRA
ncbi:MAG: hypothetical protein ACLGIP_08480 [Alphaproteobacteria bacterium]